ncbi:hypothetical protein FA15DRAFT_659619 [Coprinopsis marcescibilis]|uniref:Uncharacterized protein n=1 Tax=Coprinopsis marcescibilis TaxID=230819 RepID=A0A5C3KHV1_COPMA|nr:hypothetical protein FA15DRAFT_659619 [Coprinopsis marcescibilis]
MANTFIAVFTASAPTNPYAVPISSQPPTVKFFKYITAVILVRDPDLLKSLNKAFGAYGTLVTPVSERYNLVSRICTSLVLTLGQDDGELLNDSEDPDAERYHLECMEWIENVDWDDVDAALEGIIEARKAHGSNRSL